LTEVLLQDIDDGWCVRTWGTVPVSSGGSGRPTVADVADAGCGSDVLGEDLGLEVGADDLVSGLVAVADDEDLLEGVVDIDLVEDRVQSAGAGGAHRSEAGVGG
jgi:hypothetical protein